MSKPTLAAVVYGSHQCFSELLVSFSNDRHLAVDISDPKDNESIARAFEEMAARLRTDPQLNR